MILVGDWSPVNHSVTIKLMSAQNLYLANLEGPILRPDQHFAPYVKAGPNLFSSELPNGNELFVFSMANNHIMDYGSLGLDNTITLLDKNDFKACGAGNNIYDARRPVIIEDNGVQVGIIACCEAQFGVARRNSAGTAEFGPWVYPAIRDLCKKVDAVIVTCHAAVEDAPWPSPYIHDLYHSFIDAGAAVVHGHHAHVPQGYEFYGEGLILYGMGNFAVDPKQWFDSPNGMWSLAAEIDFRHKPAHCRLMTIEIRNQTGSETIVIEESNADEQVRHKHYLKLCNLPFDNAEMLDALWQEVAMRIYYSYGARYMGFSADYQNERHRQVKMGLSMIQKAIFNRKIPFCPGKHNFLLLYNMMACESHRQMLTTVLGILAGEFEDLRTEETRELADEMMPWSRGVIPT